MPNIFEYKIVESGIELHVLKDGQKSSLEQWNGFTDVSQLEIVSILENKILENDINLSKLPNNTGYFLSFDFISMFTEQQCKAINLPPKLPFRIKINTKGNFLQSEFKIWISVIRGSNPWPAKRTGCFVKGGNNLFMLPHNLFKVWETVDEFKNSTEAFSLDKNTSFISSLKFFLPENISKEIFLKVKSKILQCNTLLRFL